MGISNSKGNESLKKSNVRLKAQQISNFEGTSIKWYSSKKKMRAAVGTTVLLKILDSSIYASKNPTYNETIFHLFQISTVDDNAAHLVDKYEEERDGHSSFQELLKWYECDELTTETAEDVRDKLDKIKLSTNTCASEYIDNVL